MDLTQAQRLIETYNKVEAEQTARLRDLFDFVNNRKGYRHVKLGKTDMWSNCWGSPMPKDKLHEIHVDIMARPIIDFEPGAEK